MFRLGVWLDAGLLAAVPMLVALLVKRRGLRARVFSEPGRLSTTRGS